MGVFAQCLDGEHDKCQKVLNGRYANVCSCPCHTGRKPPQNPSKRCKDTGYHGPRSRDGGRCYRCGGTGEEPRQ